MSFVRDFFAPTTRSNVPLTHITTPAPDHAYPPPDPVEPGPSSAPLLTPRPGPARSNSYPDVHAHAPPYTDDDFNSRAPRASADQTRLYPPSAGGGASLSACSSATNTPLPSRAPSPMPSSYYSGTSSCSSDSEDEPDSPLLSRTRQDPSWRDSERPRWALFRARANSLGGEGRRGRRRWRDIVWGLRSCKRLVRRLVRHPFFPKTPVTIVSLPLPSSLCATDALCTASGDVCTRSTRRLLCRPRQHVKIRAACGDGCAPLRYLRTAVTVQRSRAQDFFDTTRPTLTVSVRSCSRSFSSPSSACPSRFSSFTFSTPTRSRCHGGDTAHYRPTRAGPRPLRCRRPPCCPHRYRRTSHSRNSPLLILIHWRRLVCLLECSRWIHQ